MRRNKKENSEKVNKKIDNIYNFERKKLDEDKNIEFYENSEGESKTFRKRHSKLKIIILSIISIIVILVLASYTTNQDFRNYIDLNILGKQVTENSLETIEINSDDNPTIFAYDSYIGVLSKNNLNLYNSNSTIISELDIDISTPIVETNEQFAVIAENGGNKFYVINNTEISWQGKVDGNIQKVNINQNGYVTIIVSNSTYVSIVILFNSDGTELFKTYLPTTYAMCADVSTDNSYLAIGEIDYSGTVLKSNVRVMDVSSAERVYDYSSDNNNIITNIKYYDKENAICTFTDSVVSVSQAEGKDIYTVTDDTCFLDARMSGYLSVLEKQSSGLFSYEYDLRFISLNSNTENLYILNNNLPSQVEVSGELIALNYGNEIDIVDSHGSLKKNYTSSQQIKDVVVGDSIVGVVYKDKIEIIGV